LTVRTERLDREEAGVRVTIMDNGSGIPKERLPRVFEPFYTSKARGSGLGLAITHKLITAHRGSVTIESEPGKGTVVAIVLPSAMSSPGTR
jgi:signal transduction histidine kinase